METASSRGVRLAVVLARVDIAQEVDTNIQTTFGPRWFKCYKIRKFLARRVFGQYMDTFGVILIGQRNAQPT